MESNIEIFEEDGKWCLRRPVSYHTSMTMFFDTKKEAVLYKRDLLLGKTPGEIMAERVGAAIKKMERRKFWRKLFRLGRE